MLFAGYEFAMGMLAGVGPFIILAAFGVTRARKSSAPDPRALSKAASHVVDEYLNFVRFGELIQTSERFPVGPGVGEMFQLSCRNFGDFFGKESGRRGGVRAIHYCTQRRLPKIRLPHFHRWRTAMDKNLAHITYVRVAAPIAFYDDKGNVKVTLLLEEMQNAFRLFLVHADEQYRQEFESRLGEIKCQRPPTT